MKPVAPVIATVFCMTVMPALGRGLSGRARGLPRPPRRHARPWAWHPRVHHAEIVDEPPSPRPQGRPRNLPRNSWMPGPSPGMTRVYVALLTRSVLRRRRRKGRIVGVDAVQIVLAG